MNNKFLPLAVLLGMFVSACSREADLPPLNVGSERLTSDLIVQAPNRTVELPQRIVTNGFDIVINSKELRSTANGPVTIVSFEQPAETSSGSSHNGIDGNTGRNAGKIVVSTTTLSSPLVVDNSGQDGSDGASGRNGAPGEPGNRGRNAASAAIGCKRGPGDGGRGGRGGNGGHGGNGGYGGSGGFVSISVDRLASAEIRISNLGGMGGQGGAGGSGGIGGAGGPPGRADPPFCTGRRSPGPMGSSGIDGNEGSNGENGPAGQIEVRIGEERFQETGRYVNNRAR